MRDPKRIPRILKKLEKLWTLYPDMRFVQFMLFILGNESEGPRDRFFLEDDLFEKTVDRMVCDRADATEQKLRQERQDAGYCAECATAWVEGQKVCHRCGGKFRGEGK